MWRVLTKMRTPEEMLWQAIIYTIFDDADRDIYNAKSVEFLEMQKSKRLFEMSSKYFEFLCSNINIHPDRLKLAMIEKYDRAKRDFPLRLLSREILMPSEVLR